MPASTGRYPQTSRLGAPDHPDLHRSVDLPHRIGRGQLLSPVLGAG